MTNQQSPQHRPQGSGTPRPRSAAAPQSQVRRPATAGAPPRSASGSGAQRPSSSSGHGRTKTRSFLGLKLLFVLICIFISIFLAMTMIDIFSDLFGLNQRDRATEIVVPEGATMEDVAVQLKDAEIIKYPWIFKTYAKISFDSNAVQDGEYTFNSAMSYDELIISLRTFRQKVAETVRVVFYEGMTVREIAARLEENKVCKAEEFINYLQTAELDYDFVKDLPASDLRFRRLEGYLFPDTYEFYVDEDVDTVAARFLNRFDQVISDSLLDRMKEKGWTLDQTVALASVIQKECSDAEQMGMISSVFNNRLDNYPLLQSDVTIFYYRDDIRPYLEKDNDVMYKAYSTYDHEGLPIGPICNPGLEAIKAALYPEESGYYYFVTDDAGNFYYAVTFDEHVVNVRKAGSSAHGVDVEEIH